MANQQIFKGFIQTTTATTSFNDGYIYFVRTNEGKTDGYLYFNEKRYGTAQEVRDFIGSIPSGSGNTVIEYIQESIEELGVNLTALIGEEETDRISGDTALQEAIDAEVSAREGADNALDTRIAALETDTHKHDNKSVLDDISSTDVDKWNAAEQNAKDYADELDEAMGARVDSLEAADITINGKISTLSSLTEAAIGRIDDLEEDTHTHDNKDLLDSYTQTEANLADAVTKKHEHENKNLLDSYTQTEANLADAVTKKHEHENKEVLDGITDEQVSAWDSAEENANAYTNSSLTAYATSAETVAAISSAKTEAITAATAYTNTQVATEASARTEADTALANRISELESLSGDTHTHSNKTVLDGITAEKVSAWDAAESNAKAYTNTLSSNTVNALETLSANTTVTVVTGGSSESILKSYTIKQGGTNLATIDIPKDLVVSSGEVVDISGVTYLQLTIANSNQKVNIPVGNLCDVYTGDDDTIEVSPEHVISVKADVFDAAGAADTAKSEAITESEEYTDGKLADYTTTAVTDTLQAAISTEESTRAQADSTLQSNINTEASERTAADETLQDNIDAEASARTAADTNLNNAITAESAARTAAVASLEAADSTLQSNIDAEASTRAAAVTTLETADTNLNNAITAETAARTAAVSALTTRIDALERLTGSTDSALQSISAADNSVTVGGKDSNKNQTVGVKISVANDNALKLETDGLFAAIYYDGDDVN